MGTDARVRRPRRRTGRRRWEANRPEPGSETADVGARCTCGARRFYSRDQARRYARTVQGRVGRLRAYACGRWWHLRPLTASQAAQLRRGPDANAG